MVDVENISALMDGEVAASEALGQVNRLKQDDRLRDAWDTYHVIGDTLRGEKFWFSPDFGENFRARLREEPTILAPHAAKPAHSFTRRFALPVAASVGGMMLVAWLALFNNPFAPPRENVAEIAPVQAQANAPITSQEVNDYLLAHQQFSPGTTLQGVASYVRTVSGDMEEKR